MNANRARRVVGCALARNVATKVATYTTLALAVAVAAVHAAEPSLDDIWREPPPEARVRAYWWWLNSHVDRAAITRDLEEMKAKGFGGAVIFDAGGAEQQGNNRVPAGPAFGSPEWRALLRHTLAEAERLGLEMSLNIQSGWNLGGPSVTADDAVKKLVFAETVVHGPAAVDVVLPTPPKVDGYYRDVFTLAYPLRRAHASGGVADWKAKALEEKLKVTGPNAWFLTNSAPRTDALVRAEGDIPGEEDTVAADVIDISSHVDAEGRLRWQPPRDGNWAVLRFGCTFGDVHEVSTHSDGWAGYALDVFDRGAFARYWTAAVAPILDDARPFCGRTLRYLHTDSWEVDLINWTPTLRAEFARRRGYDPLPYMPALAGRIVGSRTTTDRFLNDYRKTLGDLAFDNHYRQFHELAAKYGLQLHPESGGPHYTPIDAPRCLGIDDVPMSEFWAMSATHRTTEDVRYFVKQPASAAHTYGHRYVSAEGFTTVGPHWQETLWDNLKPSFDHALNEGLNRLVWHAFVCSPADMGLPGQQYFAGTHINPNVTWWKYARPFVTYLNRGQAMMQRGLFVADVLYYYGDHVPNFAQLRASDPAHAGVGYDYDVITEEALLERVTVRDGRLVLPDGMSYRLLVLPDRTEIAVPVLRKIRALVAAGATVLGPRPARASTLGNQPAADEEVKEMAAALWDRSNDANGQGRVVADKTARQVLQADGVPADVSFAGETDDSAFDRMHRREGDADIYFVANRRKEPVSVDATFRVSGRAPELWDAVSGEQRFAMAYRMAGGTTTVPLELPPYGSLFVVFRAPAADHPATAVSNAVAFKAVADVSGAWDVSFNPSWGGPEAVQFEKLGSWTERAEPGIKYYSGTATYRKTFTAPEGVEKSVWIDLGAVRELAAVRLNGQPLGIVWAPPFRVEATSALKPGDNVLEIDVVNFWPNRIIGDASLPPEKRFTRTNITKLTAKTPLMPSGLFGPVRLLVRER